MMKKPVRERGMVTIAAVLFLIAAVIFVLAQTRNISATTSVDHSLQLDSAAALFLAESGLERAHGIVSAAHKQKTFSAATCCINGSASCPSTGGLPAGSLALGRGNFEYVSASPIPANCTATGLNACESCMVEVRATVNSAQRSLTQTIQAKKGTGGTYCDDTLMDCTNKVTPPPVPHWYATLTNTTGYPAIAFFHLAAKRGGEQTGATCPITGCEVKWNVASANGQNSVLTMGNVITLAANAPTYLIYQEQDTKNKNFSLVENGAIFAGSVKAPTYIGAYWNSPNNGSGGTVGKNSDNSGWVNNGTQLSSTTCAAPNASAQSCDNWCHGGDTLVYAFSGGSTSLTDRLAGVSFNGIALDPVESLENSKFPATTDTDAPTSVYSQIFYKQNPDYLYGAEATGSISANQTGVTGFTADITNKSPTLAITTAGTGLLSVGDTLSGTGIPAGTRIVAQISGTPGGVGSYTMSANATNSGNGVSLSSTRTVLTVTQVRSGNLQVGQTLSGSAVTSGTTIVALGSGSGGTGTYYLSTSQTVDSRTITAGATSTDTTISVPNAAALPAVGSLVAVRLSSTQSGAIGTTPARVVSVSDEYKTFTIDKIPASALNGAQICGGTCALFDQASNSTGTGFTINRGTSSTGYWSSAFLCLKDANQPPVIAANGQFGTVAARWAEVIR